MIMILCVDDKLGMLFNNRRQSRDKALIDNVIKLCKGKKLWMNHYSYQLFEEYNCDNIIVDDSFLEKTHRGDYCFIENISLKSIEQDIV